MWMPNHILAEIEYYSIAQNTVIMYDAPSLKSEKLFVVSLYMPVEVVVNVEGWVKVRDKNGNLAWVEQQSLSPKRYVIVTVPMADIYQSNDANSGVLFQAEENLVLEWIDSDQMGWVKVGHIANGQIGYVRVNQVWGS